ncbi:3-isopropylmalate dehydratase [Stutzerimonas urumqiensis]|uniref:3-isopropylmalate dehydratase n=1 Tax=Stutzerimonas urumqiensis TaxID=638269 RepID=UPI003BAD5D5C
MRFAVLLPVLLLAGCSSWAPDPDEITPVPPDRVMAFQAPVTGGGEVVVTRHFAILGGGCFVEVRVDRQLGARIHVGERVRFQLPPGQHIVGIATDEADETLCGMGRLNREELVTVEAGEVMPMQVIVDSNIGFDIQPGGGD